MLIECLHSPSATTRHGRGSCNKSAWRRTALGASKIVVSEVLHAQRQFLKQAWASKNRQHRALTVTGPPQNARGCRIQWVITNTREYSYRPVRGAHLEGKKLATRQATTKRLPSAPHYHRSSNSPSGGLSQLLGSRKVDFKAARKSRSQILFCESFEAEICKGDTAFARWAYEHSEQARALHTHTGYLKPGPQKCYSACWRRYFWYFLLTIQNTADRQVRNLFCLLAVFISFPLARCATNELQNRIPKPGGLRTCVLCEHKWISGKTNKK
jgi:hypothetical protein